MNLYNTSLKTLIVRNIIYNQLPHTIQKDVNQLLEFKTKLKIARSMKEKIDEISIRIEDNLIESDLIENAMLWQNSNYEVYEEIQNDIQRLEREKEELEMCLRNYETDIKVARNVIEKNTVSNIDCHILYYLEQLYHY